MPKPKKFILDRATLTIGEECQIEQLTGLPISAAWEIAKTVGVAQATRAMLLVAAQRGDPDVTVETIDTWKRAEVVLELVDDETAEADGTGEGDAPA